MRDTDYQNAVVTCTDCGVVIKNFVFGQHPFNRCKNEGRAWFEGSVTFTWDTSKEDALKMSSKELISRAQARPETYLPALAATIQDLETEVASLKSQLRAAESFHAVAVQQRNTAWIENQAIEFENEGLKIKLGELRLCLNCGTTRPADQNRDALPHCVDRDSGLSACTWDATPMEALEFWRNKAYEYREKLEQQIKFRKLGY